MTTLQHAGIKEGTITNRRPFLNFRETTRDSWINKRRYN